MDQLGQSYRNWLMRQTICGVSPKQLNSSLYRIDTGVLCGHVEFCACESGHELVALRIRRAPHLKPTFFTRFVLADYRRACELFREFAKALAAETQRGAWHIALCADDPLEPHVQSIAKKLQGKSEWLALPFVFDTLSFGQAVSSHRRDAAILLTPSLAYRRDEMAEAYPHTAVFSLPASVYEHQDAHKAIRLLMEAIHEMDTSLRDVTAQLVPARPMARDGRVLALHVLYGDHSVRIGYRLFDTSRLVARGAIVKAILTMDDISDLLASLTHDGFPTESIDAIGIAVEGIVNDISMNLPGLGGRDGELCTAVKSTWGIRTFIDNSANAAAMGCYLLQDDCDSLTLYSHRLGHMNGGQGTVVDGRLVTGYAGLAGEPKLYERMFRYRENYSEAVWTQEGLTEISRNVLLATIATVSPDVVCLAVSTLDDTQSLVRDLESRLPVYCVPQIQTVDDYRDRMFLGEVALCLARLAAGV